MFMKIYVKTSSLLSAVKKVNLGLRNDEGIIVTVEANKDTSYILTLRVDSELQVYTQIPVTVEPEGTVEVMLPCMFVTAVNALSKTGDDIMLNFGEKTVDIVCKTAKIPVPYKSTQVPQLTEMEKPIATVKFESAKLKSALNSTKSFIISEKGNNNWLNCLGLRYQNGGIRFIGANGGSYAFIDIIPLSQNGMEKIPALAIPVAPFVRSLSLIDGSDCTIYVLGGEASEGVMPKKIMLQEGCSMYIMSLITVAYGNIDSLAAELIPTVRFRASVEKSKLIEAINIASVTNKTHFCLETTKSGLRLADDSGAYADIDCDIVGEMKKSLFNPSMVLSGLTSIQSEKIQILTNAEAAMRYSDQILFIISGGDEGSSSVYLPITSPSKEAAQAAEMKKKAEVQKSEAEE